MPRSALPVQNRPTFLEFPSDLFSAGRQLGKILSIGLEFCTSTLVLIGSVVLFGWFSHNQALMSVLPGRVSMKPNAAVAFLTLGIALYLRNSQASSAKLWSRVLSLLVLGLAGLTLIEYAFHIDLHIDQMLFPDPLQNPNPGRMALISAVSFFLGGTSLILLTGNQLWR